MSQVLGPTFLVVGAGKSGTTSLYDALAAHPDVFGATPKEVRYFSNFWRNGPDWYLDHFREGQNQRHRFEASPQYSFCTEFANVPKRIFDFNPAMRIVYIVREPIARIVSHFIHWNSAMPQRYPDINRALTDPAQRRPFVERTKYWMQLMPYVELFGRSQVKCITLEDLATDYVQTVNEVFHFLEIDESCRRAGPKANKGPADRIAQARDRLSSQLLDVLAEELRDDVEKILRFAQKPSDYWARP